MASLDEVAGTVGDSGSKVAEAGAVVASAKARADEVSGELNSLGAEGRASVVSGLSGQLEEVQTELSGLGDRLSEIQSAVQAAKNGLNASDGAPTRASPAQSASNTPTGHGRVPRPNMARAAAIRDYVDTQKTVGRLTSADGAELGGEIWSGREGPGKGGPGLTKPWRNMETMTEHVEGHVAAIMRRDGHRDAVLYLSRPPCITQPFGCRWQVENALPAGARLTVYTVDRRGGVKPREFIGNGAGLSDED